MSKKERHILFLSSWNPCPKNPTLGNFILRHAESIALLNKVFFIRVCSSKKHGISVEQDGNLQIISIFYKKSRCRLLNIYRYFNAYMEGVNKIKAEIDIIHANVVFPVGLMAVFLKWKLKTPFILTEHWSIYFSSSSKKITSIQKKLFVWIANKASYITPVSSVLQKAMQIDIHKQYKIIPNSVDTNIFYYQEKNKSEWSYFVHISTLAEVKNISGILEAFSRLLQIDKKNKLSIISDGETSKASALINKFNIPKENIEIIGTSTAKEIARYLNKADAYVQFSQYETFGLVAAEALCCGTPVISTPVGFLGEYPESDIGCFVISINELTLKMKNIKSISFKHKEQSLFFCNLFNNNTIAQSYSNLYDTILNEN